MADLIVGITVVCGSQTEALHAAEVLGRSMAGLAMDGLHASLHCHPAIDDEETDDAH